MLRSLLFLPVALWLLVPPGFCICHLPEKLLAALGADELGTPGNESPDAEDEDDHLPSCPARKIPSLPSKCATAPHDGLGVMVAILAEPGAPGPVAGPCLALETPPPIHSSDKPIYLTVRALLI